MTADAAPARPRAWGAPAHLKVAVAVLVVMAVVGTRREAMWAFALHAGIVVALARAAATPLREVARRLPLELPVVVGAAALPFVASGTRVGVGPLDLSRPGLWAAWNVVAKATLSLAAVSALVVPLGAPEVVRALESLRAPRALTAVAGFMARYAAVLAGELSRLQIARVSRGHDPRWLGQARAIGTTAGALFVRTFERGERVHLAMLSRGFDGTLPFRRPPPASQRQRAVAVLAVVAAVAVAAASWLS